jgi:adenine-specific DNA-methyltransferase
MTTLNFRSSGQNRSNAPSASDGWIESERKPAEFRIPRGRTDIGFEQGQDQITSLRIAYPNLFTKTDGSKGTGKLDLEKVKAEIGRGNFVEKEEFGLKWDNSKVDRNLDTERKENLVVFNYVPDLGIGDGTSENLLIEGDNFDALRYISSTHRGKVNCIYIDPPYNTGNRDFIYEDNYQDKSVTFRHSKWLSFMNARLLLAKDILAVDGVILVSIDDNEYHHLKMLMDQIFPSMYRGTFVWKRRSGANDAKGAFLSSDHEYVLCYSGKGFSFGGQQKDFSSYRPSDDDFEPWKSGPLTKAHGHKERPNTFYPLYNPETDIWYPCNPNRVWMFSSKNRLKPNQKLRAEPMEDLVAKKRILFPVAGDFVIFNTLEDLKDGIKSCKAPTNLRLDTYTTAKENDSFLSFFIGKKVGLGNPSHKKYLKEIKSDSKPLSTWVIPSSETKGIESADVDFLSWGFTAEGTKLIQEMLGSKAFSYPKPLSLVKALIAQSTQPGDLVLDFFGGSGTTGHAVMAINAENDTEDPRRFIVASSTESTENDPGKNICRDVTAARLSAASQGYQFRKRTGFESVAGLGGNFSYMKASVIPLNEIVFELQAEQIWNALQLSFSKSFLPFNAKLPVQFIETSEGVIAYCVDLHTESAIKSIQELVKLHGTVNVFFQKLSAKARTSLEGTANLQKIPQELLSMFGIDE